MPGQADILLPRDHSADHKATEQVQDDVGVQVQARGQGRQFGDIPGHNLVGRGGLQLMLDMVLRRALGALFTRLPPDSQPPVHGRDRGDQLTLAEQRGMDLTRCGVLEALRVQMIKQRRILGRAQASLHGGLRLALIPPVAAGIAPVPRDLQGTTGLGLGDARRQRLWGTHDFGSLLSVSNRCNTFFGDRPVARPHRHVFPAGRSISLSRESAGLRADLRAARLVSPCSANSLRQFDHRPAYSPLRRHQPPLSGMPKASASASNRFFSATLNRRRVRFSSRGSVTTSLKSDLVFTPRAP